MAESIVINNSPQGGQSSGGFLGSSLSRLISIVAIVVILIIVLIITISAYALYINWDYIVAFFTTGLIGWLNPFDDPAGDTSPGEGVAGAVVQAPLGNGWRIITAPFRWLW